MNDREPAPLMTPATLDGVVAALIERVNAGFGGVHDRLDAMTISQSEHRSAAQTEARRLDGLIEGLLQRESERNGHIVELMRGATANEERWQKHTAWSDEKANQLKELVQTHRDSALVAGARRKLLSAQWRWFLGGVAAASAVLGVAGGVLELLGKL